MHCSHALSQVLMNKKIVYVIVHVLGIDGRQAGRFHVSFLDFLGLQLGLACYLSLTKMNTLAKISLPLKIEIHRSEFKKQVSEGD